MSHPESNPLLAAALDYARRGWRVVPLHSCVADERRTDGKVGCSCGNPKCKSQGKHPRFNAWQNEASTDERQVRAWWAKWPEANVGVALGPDSGIVSIDVDTTAGEELIKALAGGQVERTVLYKTGKGHRLLYAVPAGLSVPPVTRVVQDGGTEAVRFQSTGAQCVMPPSRHPDGVYYEWLPERDPASRGVAPMPEWLVAEMCRPNSPEWSDQGAREAFLEGKDFNRDADWYRDVLEPAGFTPAGQVAGVLRFTRPGKEGGISVTVGHYRARDGSPALFVFSGSIPGLAAWRCYDKFGAYAHLHHGGDFARASAELTAKGFGRPKRAAAAAVAAVKEADWEPLVPLPGLPEVPEFPLHVFPPALACFVDDVAATTNTPPDFAAGFVLAVAAGAVGATRAVSIKEGHVQRSSLYLCAVAQKGSGKSPALDAVVRPLYDEQARLHRDKEKQRKAFVGDVTAEKLAEVLNDNPRGALMVRDELAGWLTSFNQYKAGGRGSDRQFYLSAWNGTAVSVDRKNKDAEPVYVRYPSLTVVGTIQPSVLDRFRADADDGFYDRVLFCYPNDRPLVGEQWRTIDGARAERWAEAVRDLRRVQMVEASDGSDRPFFLHLDEGARAGWKDWTDRVAELVNGPEFDPNLRGPAVKLSGYAARLALIVHMLRFAYQDPVTDTIDAEDMSRGSDLGWYFLGHAARAWTAAGIDAQCGPARRLLRWVQESGVRTFTRRDAHRALSRSFPNAEDLSGPLRKLIDHGHIRYARPVESPKDERPAPGRTAVEYEVHPDICQRCQQSQRVNGVSVSAHDTAPEQGGSR